MSGDGAALRDVPCPSQFAGVYVFIRRDRAAYVGQSECVVSRVNTHRKNGERSRALFVQISSASVRNAVERGLIRALRPYKNVSQGVGCGPIGRAAARIVARVLCDLVRYGVTP